MPVAVSFNQIRYLIITLSHTRKKAPMLLLEMMGTLFDHRQVKRPSARAPSYSSHLEGDCNQG